MFTLSNVGWCVDVDPWLSSMCPSPMVKLNTLKNRTPTTI